MRAGTRRCDWQRGWAAFAPGFGVTTRGHCAIARTDSGAREGEWRRGWDSDRAKLLLSITCGNRETLKVTETLKSRRVGTIQER